MAACRGGVLYRNHISSSHCLSYAYALGGGSTALETDAGRSATERARASTRGNAAGFGGSVAAMLGSGTAADDADGDSEERRERRAMVGRHVLARRADARVMEGEIVEYHPALRGVGLVEVGRRNGSVPGHIRMDLDPS